MITKVKSNTNSIQRFFLHCYNLIKGEAKLIMKLNSQLIVSNDEIKKKN